MTPWRRIKLHSAPWGVAFPPKNASRVYSPGHCQSEAYLSTGQASKHLRCGVAALPPGWHPARTAAPTTGNAADHCRPARLRELHSQRRPQRCRYWRQTPPCVAAAADSAGEDEGGEQRRRPPTLVLDGARGTIRPFMHRAHSGLFGRNECQAFPRVLHARREHAYTGCCGGERARWGKEGKPGRLGVQNQKRNPTILT